MISIFKKLRIKLLAEMLTPTHLVAVDDDGNLGKTAYPEVGATITNTSELVNNGETGDSRFVQEDEISGLVLQPPYLRELVPDGFLPSTTGNYILRGSFFTPDMVITIEGHTTNNQAFISSGEFIVNLTRSATEGLYDVTLNNGLEATFADQLQVENGSVYQPTNLDWINESGSPLEYSQNGAKLTVFNSHSLATWNRQFDFTKDFKLTWKFKSSPLGTNIGSVWRPILKLIKQSDLSEQYFVDYRLESNSGRVRIKELGQVGETFAVVTPFQPTAQDAYDLLNSHSYEFWFISGLMYFYIDGVFKHAFSIVSVTENLMLKLDLYHVDIVDIKHIDLTDTSGDYTDYSKLISQFTNDIGYLKTDLSSLGAYADDTAAASGGVEIGFAYINSSTGALHRRLT